MANFLHIYIRVRPYITSEQIEEKMNLALDWFRYDKKCYIVYTTSSIDKWIKRLEPFVKPNGLMFICKFDTSQRNGWMSPKFWEWLHKHNDY